MYALIYDREGNEQARYPLGDNDVLDTNAYAERFASEQGIGLILTEAHIPDGTEDYRVTLQEVPGSVVCWSSKNYMAYPDAD